MTEELFQYIWKFGLFKKSDLTGTKGEKITVIKTGEHNKDSGPDFFNSRIAIDETQWAGNVELHMKTGDWLLHKHQNDKAYKNLVLHVVYEHDKNIPGHETDGIPTLELRDHIDVSLIGRYEALMNNTAVIPCQWGIGKIDPFVIDQRLQALVIERLEEKCEVIFAELEKQKNNWEETFYIFMARNFGFRINSDPFEMLARAIPHSLFAKIKNNPLQIEALLMGTAGFLEGEKFEEEFPLLLQREFQFLKNKNRITPLQRSLWKFAKLRPANFPTVRIAQFSRLIFYSSHLFATILEKETKEELAKMLRVSTSEYWLNHYRFEKKSFVKPKLMGDDAVENILINTVIPFLFIYGRSIGKEVFCERALKFLEEIPSENNAIIRTWESLGIRSKSAAHSQGLIQLNNNYCSKKKCLQCSIGMKILQLEKV